MLYEKLFIDLIKLLMNEQVKQREVRNFNSSVYFSCIIHVEYQPAIVVENDDRDIGLINASFINLGLFSLQCAVAI